MFLQSRNITVHREGSPTLTFPDFSINIGEAALMLGPSGSGKTTFLSILAGLLNPSQGHVLIEGNDFYAVPPARRDQIRGQSFGFVFQTLHLLPSLTLAQNIALAADMAKSNPEEGRVETLLEALGLHDKAHRTPDALSQGEQQRAAIARAVLLRPKIIIADEPTSALDDENTQKVMDLLEQQAQETGAALLIATHDSRIKNRFRDIISLDGQKKEAA